MGAHALLSPSSAHRWLHCTASPRLELPMEDTGSSYALEGTLAHAVAAKALKESQGRGTESEDSEIAALSAEYLSGEMPEHVENYTGIVLGKLAKARKSTGDAYLWVEQRLDLTDYAPGMFGTADAIVVADGTMEVIDLKYGKGVRVSSEGNPQMMAYALGALELVSWTYDIRTVRMTIVQPRLIHISEWEIGADELRRWGEETLRRKAAEALLTAGRVEPGDWCRFCKVKAMCRALGAKAAKMTANDPRLMSPADLAREVLPWLPIVKSWVSSAEDYALGQALDGTVYPGYKVVEGRSVRKVTDTPGLIASLMGAGYAEEEVLRPRELRTLGDLEKAIGRKRFAELSADYITKAPGKPALVPDTDERAPLGDATEDFKHLINP